MDEPAKKIVMSTYGFGTTVRRHPSSDVVLSLSQKIQGQRLPIVGSREVAPPGERRAKVFVLVARGRPRFREVDQAIVARVARRFCGQVPRLKEGRTQHLQLASALGPIIPLGTILLGSR